MNMNYKSLGEISTITSSKRIFAEQYVSEGIPFYRQKEIIEKHDKKQISDPLYISNEVYETIKNKFGIPKNGDLLLSAVGALGIPYVVQDEQFYFKDGNLIWLKDFDSEINSKYIYYWIDSKFGYESLYLRAIGSAQPALTIDIVKKYKLFVPEKKIQDKIANILSRYDEAIENNNKRIKLLEQMAETYYKHVFSSEKTKGKSDRKTLSEILTLSRGLSYSSEEIECEEGNNLINLKNIQGFGGFRLDGTKKYDGKYKKEQIVTEGDLIMGVTDMTQDRRTVGSVALIPSVSGINVISADLVKINSKISNVFLYGMFRYGNVSRHLSQFANGANVLHLRPDAILRTKVFVPEIDLIEKYTKLSTPIYKEINMLNEKNQNLTKQRDLLLPRLMSGKLEVK